MVLVFMAMITEHYENQHPRKSVGKKIVTQKHFNLKKIIYYITLLMYKLNVQLIHIVYSPYTRPTVQKMLILSRNIL